VRLAYGPRITGLASGVSHRLAVSAPGYQEETVTVTGEPHETKRVEITLTKMSAPRAHRAPASAGPSDTRAPTGTGKLNVGATGGWCNVTVDGTPRGATPVAGLELPAGTHKIACAPESGKTQHATVVVPEGGTARYKFEL
jgi:eukaryotic-like serine/threonine-protein kinase